MCSDELRDFPEVLHDRGDVRELSHIDILALSVVNHGGKEGVRQSDDVAKAVLAFGRLDLLLKGSETLDDDPLGPGLLVVGAEFLADLLEHTEVLWGLEASVDHFAKASNLEALDGVLWEQFPLARVALFQELANSHRFGQRHGFLDDVFVLNDQRWDELQ